MKKILLTIITLILFIPYLINAEELKLDWQKNWGGNNYENFYDLLQTSDGGFVAYGYSNSTDIEGLPNKGFQDAIIVKYDKNGNMLWQNSWSGNGYEQFNDLIQTSDGGFVASGYSNSTDIEGLPNKGDIDAIIVKYDKDGNMLWQKSWGGNGDDDFNGILQTQDGGFIGYGSSMSTDIESLSNKGNYDAIIVRYDKDGNMLWQTSWGCNDWDKFDDVIQISDGGFVVYVNSDSTDIEGLANKGYTDAIIVKYDKDGNMLWQKSWGGNNEDHFNGISQTQDGGFIGYGNSHSTDIEGLINKGLQDAIIVKYDKDGNMLWQKSWGGENTDEFYTALQTQDGGFIGYGNSRSTDIEGLINKGLQDAIIVKYDKDGNMLWQKNWGGNSDDYFKGISQTQNSGFVGYINSASRDIEGLSNKGGQDAVIVKYDKNGNMLWQKNWGGNSTDYFNGILQTQDGEFIIYGYSLSTNIEGLLNKGRSDTMIVKYSIEYILEDIITENGISTTVQQGSKGIITTTPNEGYEVDKIIIKDKERNVLDVEVTKLEEQTYSFDLYTDVSVEVTFKEIIDNPTTGVLDIITILFVGVVISLCGFILVKNYNERYEI